MCSNLNGESDYGHVNNADDGTYKTLESGSSSRLYLQRTHFTFANYSNTSVFKYFNKTLVVTTIKSTCLTFSGSCSGYRIFVHPKQVGREFGLIRNTYPKTLSRSTFYSKFYEDGSLFCFADTILSKAPFYENGFVLQTIRK